MIFDITSFGAVADGSVQTAAIQRALDACRDAGGGCVIIPAGTFVTGSLRLFSHTELHLEAGAVLKGSPDFADYIGDDAYEQNWGCPPEQWNAGHLIYAVEETDITLSGPGTVDGNAPAFVTAANMRPKTEWNALVWRDGFASAPRPGQCIVFVECTDVRILNLNVRDATAWDIFLHGCTRVHVTGVTIQNPSYIANTDGIDVDCCRFVTISDCRIDTGDDGITVRSDPAFLKNKQPCEYITVTNCVLAASADAVRIGVGRGIIRHVNISSLVVSRAAKIIDICSEYVPNTGTPISDVRISDLVGEDIVYPFHLEGKYGTPIHSLTVQNVFCTSLAGIKMVNAVPEAISDITLRNFDIRLRDSDIELTPSIRASRGEAAFIAKRISGLRAENVRIFPASNTKKDWRNGVSVTDCPDAEFKSCSFPDGSDD